MPRYQSDVAVLGSTQLVIGYSAILKVTPSANQYAETLKWISGGSLEIVKPQLSGASTGTGVQGTGYMLGTTEIFNIGGPAIFYLAATGSTAVAHLSIGYTHGMTNP